MQIPPDIFDSVCITRVLEWCWVCCHADWYDRTDHHFVDAIEIEDVVISLP